MGPGLLRILDRIKANPSDTMLVDRFLVLAADTPEHERVEATLGLARALLAKSPRRSIEICWMVYKSGLRDVESLAIISDALEGLGKPNKAAIIRSEMRRLTSDKLSEDAKSLARLTIEEHVTNTLSGLDDRVVPQFNDLTKSNHLAVAKLDLDLIPPVPDQAPSQLSELSSVTTVAAMDPPPIMSLSLDPESGVMPGAAPARTVLIDPVAESARAARIAKINVKSALNIMPVSQKAQPVVAVPAAGIPEAIPPKEPSRHSMAISDQRPSAYSQDSSQHSKTSFSDHSGGKIMSRKSMSPEERRQRLSDLIIAEEWESVLELLRVSFATADDPILLSVFEDHKLARIDIRFAGWWLDILIAARQERRAIRFIIQQLNDEPHLAWARMMWPKVSVIRDILELNEIDWRESDGVVALRDRIASLRPRVGCYWVARIAS